MSLTDNTATDPGKRSAKHADAGAKINSDFRFVPNELAVKCRELIQSFHTVHGYIGLPDMLWLSDARNIIQRHSDLTQIFKKASRSRGAKRANDLFLHIATIVASLEVLARDFAGWGKRFPTAKREADELLGAFQLRQRLWLIDLYFYPSLAESCRRYRQVTQTQLHSRRAPAPSRFVAAAA